MYPYPTNMGEPAFAGSIPTPQEAALMQEANARRQHMLSATQQRDLDLAKQSQEAALMQKSMIESNSTVPQGRPNPYSRNPNESAALRRMQEIEAGANVDQDNMAPTGIVAKPNTGNARGSTLPMQTIGNNEMLMRVGGAMMGGASQGGLNAYNQAINEYGRIQDYNRQGERLAYQDETKRLANEAKNQQKQTDENAGFIVNDDVDIAMEILGSDADGVLANLFKFDLPAAGGLGNMLKNAPFDTDAKALRGRLETIQANIGFDKLQNMRDLSPTGGALGQVSERELAFLQSTFGSLEQSLSSRDLYYNLGRLQYYYNNLIHGKGNHKYQMPSYSDFANLKNKQQSKTSSDDFTADQKSILDRYLPSDEVNSQ